jgi:hypothetical protein
VAPLIATCILLLFAGLLAVTGGAEARWGLRFLAGGVFAVAAVLMFLGYVGATDDVGSSWSSGAPRVALRWAEALAIAGIGSLLALLWDSLKR